LYKQAESCENRREIPMASPNLTEAMVRQHAAADSFSRGQEYYRQGAVVSLVRRGDTLRAEVEGSAPMPYRVVVTFDAADVTAATCSCPYASSGYGGWCKHIVAALLTYINAPEQVEERPPLADLLAELDSATLRELLLDLVAHDPDVADRIEARLPLLAAPMAATGDAPPDPTGSTVEDAPPVPTGPTVGNAPPPRLTPVDAKAVRRQVRAALRDATSYDYDYYDDDGGAAADATRGTVDQAWAYIAAGDAPNALTVLEVLIEEYIEQLDLIGESEGLFSELGTALAEALLSMDLTPTERRDWTEKLAEWRGQADDYGSGAGLLVAQEALKQGWDYPPLQRVLRGEITEAGAWEQGEEPLAYADELAEARLNVLERQGRLQEYLYLAEAEGQTARYTTMLVRLDRVEEAVAYGLEHLITPEETLTLATALRERGDLENALRVAARGLDLEGQGKAELAVWLRDLAAGMGRTDVALTAALAAFREQLDLASYLRAQEIAGAAWPEYRPALLDRLRAVRSYYPQGPVDVFLHEGLIADAIAAVDAGATHTLVERVADAAIATRPDWVIAASRKQAEDIMNGGKSQYYGAAAQWLTRARDAYRAADREPEWRAYRADLLVQHARKYKLMPLLKALT